MSYQTTQQEDSATGNPVNQNSTNGAAHVTDPELNTKILTSGGYTYIAKAPVGTPEASALWQVKRIDSAGSVMWADHNTNFDNAAGDAALTGATYSYS